MTRRPSHMVQVLDMYRHGNAGKPYEETLKLVDLLVLPKSNIPCTAPRAKVWHQLANLLGEYRSLCGVLVKLWTVSEFLLLKWLPTNLDALPSQKIYA